MRIVKEVLKNQLKITIFSWNGKYLIKFEQGDLEQTYKIDELDLMGESDIDLIINDDFLEKVKKIFRQMSQDFSETLSII